MACNLISWIVIVETQGDSESLRGVIEKHIYNI